MWKIQHIYNLELMTAAERDKLCRSGKLDDSHVRAYWGKMTDNEKRSCLCFGKYSTELIEDLWDKMTEEERDICCWNQYLTQEFMIHHFGRMIPNQKKGCLRYQDFMSNIDLGELPQYLADEVDEVYGAAKSRLDELRKP